MIIFFFTIPNSVSVLVDICERKRCVFDLVKSIYKYL